MVNDLVVANPADDVVSLAVKHNTDLVLVLNGVVLPAEKIDLLRKVDVKQLYGLRMIPITPIGR